MFMYRILFKKKHPRKISVFIEQFHLPWLKEIASKKVMEVKQQK